MGSYQEKYAQFTNLEGGPLLILPAAIIAINTCRKEENPEERDVIIQTWGWLYAVQETLDEVLRKIDAVVIGAEP